VPVSSVMLAWVSKSLAKFWMAPWLIWGAFPPHALHGFSNCVVFLFFGGPRCLGGAVDCHLTFGLLGQRFGSGGLCVGQVMAW